MSVFLFLLGLAMMVTGLAAIYSGSLFVGIERGWTMVVAGSIGFSAGAILLGLGAVLRRLKRIEKATKRLAGGLFALVQPGSDASAEVPAILQAIAEPPLAAVSPAVAAKAAGLEPARSRPEPDPASEPVPPAPDKIVGTYQAGGCSYVMFADGSIRAQTPSGEHRFASMDEFKAFMLTGSVRSRPPETPAKGEEHLALRPDAQPSDSPTALSAKA